MNSQEILKKIEGKECLIDDVCIYRDKSYNKSSINFQIKIKNSEIEALMTAYNASGIKLDFSFCPLTICGLKIIDNKSKGWSKDVRYFLSDIENDSIKLYCEKFEIKLC